MKYQVFWNGNVWTTDEVIYRPEGGVEFEAQGKDGKFRVVLRTFDIISERLSNISVPLEVIK